MSPPALSSGRPHEPSSSPFAVAVASFCNMFSVGSVYALGAIHSQLPRLLGVTEAAKFAPFAAASVGLAVGVITGTSLIASGGPHSIVARGTGLWAVGLVGAGLSIQRLSFELLLACLCVGGIGVGWTYLAVVMAIGQAFPNTAAARSGIGPLGFSSGAGASFYAFIALGSNTATAADYGAALINAGLGFGIIGLATHLLVADTPRAPVPKSSAATDQFDERGFYLVLLFFNALPGMTILAVLPMLMERITQTPASAHLPYSMVALGVSGPLAPFVVEIFGLEGTFQGTLCLRGALLIAASIFVHPLLALVTLCAVLFGHGTGFGVLPALVMADRPTPESFANRYGQVLGSWGIAGVVGCSLNAALATSPEKLSLLLGVVTVTYGLLVSVAPWPRRGVQDVRLQY